MCLALSLGNVAVSGSFKKTCVYPLKALNDTLTLTPDCCVHIKPNSSSFGKQRPVQWDRTIFPTTHATKHSKNLGGTEVQVLSFLSSIQNDQRIHFLKIEWMEKKVMEGEARSVGLNIVHQPFTNTLS